MKKLISCFTITLAATALGATLLGAQAHPGGVLLGGGYPSNSTSYLNGLFEVDRSTGAMTTFVDTFTATRPYYFQQTEMNVDNQSIAFVTAGSTSAVYSHTYGLFTYDPQAKKYSTIARDKKDFEWLYGLSIGQDGDYYMTGYGRDVSNRTQYRVYRVTAPGQWTTVLTTQQLGHTQSFRYPTIRDVDSGDLLVPSGSTVGFFRSPVYSLSEDGTIGTWNMSNQGPTPSYGMAQQIATGDLFHMSGRTIYRTKKGRTATSSAAVVGLTSTAYCVVFENQSKKNPQLITYRLTQSNGSTVAALEFIDTATNTVTKTLKFVDTKTRTQVPYPQRNALNANARYLQTIKAGKRTWDLKISAPAFPGKNYAIAAGFSGIRPGIPFAGRRIWLNLDALTPLVVDNKIATVFNPGPLTLDANGRATGKINSRFMPASVRLPIHIVLAVLDPAAPQGIAFISEPFPMTL